MQATTIAPFVWDHNYDNTEQMRPYLADFLAIYNTIQGTAYNDLFKGKIPGLAGSVREDTGIYLLQTLAQLDELQERKAQFIADGGYYLTDRVPLETERGTLVRFGWYMGGTGWAEHHSVKVKIDTEKNRVLFKFPRQKNWRTHHNGPSGYLFMPDR